LFCSTSEPNDNKAEKIVPEPKNAGKSASYGGDRKNGTKFATEMSAYNRARV
jgi:hypothetical protein